MSINYTDICFRNPYLKEEFMKRCQKEIPIATYRMNQIAEEIVYGYQKHHNIDVDNLIHEDINNTFTRILTKKAEDIVSDQIDNYFGFSDTDRPESVVNTHPRSYSEKEVKREGYRLPPVRSVDINNFDMNTFYPKEMISDNHFLKNQMINYYTLMKNRVNTGFRTSYSLKNLDLEDALVCSESFAKRLCENSIKEENEMDEKFEIVKVRDRKFEDGTYEWKEGYIIVYRNPNYNNYLTFDIKGTKECGYYNGNINPGNGELFCITDEACSFEVYSSLKDLKNNISTYTIFEFAKNMDIYSVSGYTLRDNDEIFNRFFSAKEIEVHDKLDFVETMKDLTNFNYVQIGKPIGDGIRESIVDKMNKLFSFNERSTVEYISDKIYGSVYNINQYKISKFNTGLYIVEDIDKTVSSFMKKFEILSNEGFSTKEMLSYFMKKF